MKMGLVAVRLLEALPTWGFASPPDERTHTRVVLIDHQSRPLIHEVRVPPSRGEPNFCSSSTFARNAEDSCLAVGVFESKLTSHSRSSTSSLGR